MNIIGILALLIEGVAFAIIGYHGAWAVDRAESKLRERYA